MTRKERLSAVMATVAVCTLLCTASSGGDVVLNPSASRLWSTVTEDSVEFSLLWPDGATTAKVSVPASGLFAGVEAVLTNGVHSSFTLELPRPLESADEYTVSPVLEFSNLEGDVLAPTLTARIGVAREASPFKGTDMSSAEWRTVKKGGYLIPVLAEATSEHTEYGGSCSTNQIPSDSSWLYKTFDRTGPYSLSLLGTDGTLSASALLEVLAKGLVFSLR